MKKKANKHFKDAPKKVLSNREKLVGSEFRVINEKLYTTTSSTAKEWFNKNPKYFDVMHNGFALQAKTWPIVPVDEVIKWVKNSLPKSAVIADMGCGEAKLASSVENKVHSFDFKAKSKLVTECDMSHTPLSTAECDVVVFVLSLMGTNLCDFLQEAKRILKIGGILLVIEVTSRIEDPNVFAKGICDFGFEQTKRKSLTNYFTWLEFKSTPETGSGHIELKPCIYKRR